jgi:hypothetical protein
MLITTRWVMNVIQMLTMMEFQTSNFLVLSIWLKVHVRIFTGPSFNIYQTETEACLFYKLDRAPVKISISDTTITTKTLMNIIGVIFDAK